MRIFLLRHAESVDEIEDCYGGLSDFPLTEAGRADARELAAELADSGIGVLYAGPDRRGHGTAAILGKALGCEVRIVDDLVDRNSYGVLSGVERSKAREIFGPILKELEHTPGDYYAGELIPGAEPVDEFDSRVRNVFETIVRDASGRDVIGVVTHGSVIRAVCRHFLGVSGRVKLGSLSIIVMRFEPAIIQLDGERSRGVEVEP